MKNFSDLFSSSLLEKRLGFLTPDDIVKGNKYTWKDVFGFLENQLRNPFKKYILKWKPKNAGRMKRTEVEQLQNKIKKIFYNFESNYGPEMKKAAKELYNTRKKEALKYFQIKFDDSNFFPIHDDEEEEILTPEVTPEETKPEAIETPEAIEIPKEIPQTPISLDDILPEPPTPPPPLEHEETVSKQEITPELFKDSKTIIDYIKAKIEQEHATDRESVTKVAYKCQDEISNFLVANPEYHVEPELSRITKILDETKKEILPYIESFPPTPPPPLEKDEVAVEQESESELALRFAADAPIPPPPLAPGEDPVPPPEPPEKLELINREDVEEIKKSADPRDFQIFVNDAKKYNLIARRLELGIREFVQNYFEKTVRPLRVKIGELLYPYIFPSNASFVHVIDTDDTFPSASRFGAGNQTVAAARKWNTDSIKAYMQKVRASIPKETVTKDFANGTLNVVDRVVNKLLPMKKISSNLNIDAPGNLEKEIRAWLIGYPISELGVKHTAQETKENNVYGPGINARIYQFIMEGVMEVVDRVIDKENKPLTDRYESINTFAEYLTELWGFRKEAKADRTLSKDIKAKTLAYRQAIKMVEVDLVNETIKAFEPFIRKSRDNAKKTFAEIAENEKTLNAPITQIKKFYYQIKVDQELLNNYLVFELGNALKIAAKEQNIHPQQNKDREETRRQLYTLPKPDGRDLTF